MTVAREETPKRTPPVAAPRGSRRRWSGWTRLAGAATLGVLLLIAGSECWRAVSLWGLPDVGDPFDVAAAGYVRISDADNAFIDYQLASSMIGWKEPPNMGLDWAAADAATRAWLESCRPALEIWRAGTEARAALYYQPAETTFNTILPVTQKLRSFGRLALLEGSRRESAGELAEAWGWYRALLRSSRHTGSHGFMVERLVGVVLHRQAAERIMRWAADPRVDTGLLRRALDEVIAIDAMTPKTSEILKVEYLQTKALDDPKLPEYIEMFEANGGPRPPRWQAWLPWRWLSRGPAAAYSLREPERSRRVLRLIFANWLAHCDDPKRLRPPLADESLHLFRPAPDDPPAARALPVDRLVRWTESTLYARHMAGMQQPWRARFVDAVDGERALQARLVVALAGELYRREHGKPPPSPEALVGPYLRALPEGYEP